MIDADGLIVMPGIVDAHTHYDPQLTFEPFATSSCFHGVTSVVAGNCGYSIAPVRQQDHDYLTALFAKVEGMTPSVLAQGLPWDWDSFPSFLEALDKRLGINARRATSATRPCAASSWATRASERAATADELEHMKRLVREAMARRRGRLLFVARRRRTSISSSGRCRRATAASTRSRRWPRPRARAAPAASPILPEIGAARVSTSTTASGSSSWRSRSGLPIVIQGMG